MSLKINKNGKEYDLGFVPQSLYNDVEDSLYKVGDSVSGLFYTNGFIDSDRTMYALLALKKSLSDNISSASASLTDSSIYIYGSGGYQVLTTGALSVDVSTVNGFRIKIQFPANTFGSADIGKPCSFAFMATITFS
jgi:hypothetical protein